MRDEIEIRMALADEEVILADPKIQEEEKQFHDVTVTILKWVLGEEIIPEDTGMRDENSK